MSTIAPESLVAAWFSEYPAVARTATSGLPFAVPYDRLASIDGWLLRAPSTPDTPTTPLPPIPHELLVAIDHSGIGATMLIAADYAVRRGATDAATAARILAAESPVAIAIGRSSTSIPAGLLEATAAAGVPVLDAVTASAALPAPFLLRAVAHAANIGRLHDPALSFQERVVEETIGGNSLSSFILHNEGEVDGVRVTGELSARVGIEIGLIDEGIDVTDTSEIEELAVAVPSFLNGVCSWREGNSLALGWRSGDAPSARTIGNVIRVWLKGLLGIQGVDVRLAFAPPQGRSALLTDMRARAAAFRQYRAAVIAGDPDPLAAVSNNLIE